MRWRRKGKKKRGEEEGRKRRWMSAWNLVMNNSLLSSFFSFYLLFPDTLLIIIFSFFMSPSSFCSTAHEIFTSNAMQYLSLFLSRKPASPLDVLFGNGFFSEAMIPLPSFSVSPSDTQFPVYLFPTGISGSSPELNTRDGTWLPNFKQDKWMSMHLSKRKRRQNKSHTGNSLRSRNNHGYIRSCQRVILNEK